MRKMTDIKKEKTGYFDSNIYSKLDIHNKMELLDAFEQISQE